MTRGSKYTHFENRQRRETVGAEQFAPVELMELAVEAEVHGMDSAAVSDHFQPCRQGGGHAPFSLARRTAVGERTCCCCWEPQC